MIERYLSLTGTGRRGVMRSAARSRWSQRKWAKQVPKPAANLYERAHLDLLEQGIIGRVKLALALRASSQDQMMIDHRAVR
jgi:hypothetical protein